MADNLIPGTDEEDARLDAAVRDYLAARLDGQLGRSAAHFHRHLAGPGARSGGAGGAGSSRRRGPGFGPGGGVVGVVGGALAASLAALWAGPSLRLDTPPATPGETRGVTAGNVGASSGRLSGADFQVDELTLCSQTRDAGTVLLDGRTAARRLVRRELKQTRWVDPRAGASLERIEPRQDVMLIQLDTY